MTAHQMWLLVVLGAILTISLGNGIAGVWQFSELVDLDTMHGKVDVRCIVGAERRLIVSRRYDTDSIDIGLVERWDSGLLYA